MNVKNIKKMINKNKGNNLKVLKAAMDPFLASAIVQGTYGTGVLIVSIVLGFISIGFFYKSGLEHYEIHKNVIVNGTQILLQASLEHEPGINREVFLVLFDLFEQYKLSPEGKSQALNSIINNLNEYRDTQAISELEGQKLQQVINELKRLYEIEVDLQTKLNQLLQNNKKKSKGFIE